MNFERNRLILGRAFPIFSYILILIFFGLWPFNFFQLNNAGHESSSPLRLDPVSTVYTSAPPQKISEIKTFTIFINLSSAFIGSNGYARILCYSLDEERQNFMVGQWEDSLVFKMKADGRSRPIHFETDGIFKKDERISLAIIFSGSSLIIYQGEEKIKERKTGPLTFSSWDKSYPLVIGSEGNGKFPWGGRIYSIAIFDRALTEEEIKVFGHEQSIAAKPLIGCNFVGNEEAIIKDSGKGIPADLIIPKYFTPYKRTFLEKPHTEWPMSSRDLKDILINVAGFIPLGFLLAGYLKNKGFRPLVVVLISIGMGFGISLLIEVLQAFLPSRSSDMMDLIANTFGTMIGCLGFCVSGRSPQRSQSSFFCHLIHKP